MGNLVLELKTPTSRFLPRVKHVAMTRADKLELQVGLYSRLLSPQEFYVEAFLLCLILQRVNLIAGVVGGTDEGAGFDVADAEGLADILEFDKLFGAVVAFQLPGASWKGAGIGRS